MDVRKVLKSKEALVNEAVLKMLPEKHEIPEIQKMYDMMRDYPKRGGKRLRPALILLATKMFGGKEGDALTTAAALELFHDWILIHDDIEDGSEVRRGQPCLHKKHGIELAINAGDAVHVEMWKILINQKLSQDKKDAILNAFGELLTGTPTGQAMEIDWVVNNKWNITEEDYFEMTKRKTALYTTAYPIYIGAIIAGKQEYKNQIFDFGEPFGKAFQIQDDVLDLTAEKEKFGKQKAGDIYEGKRTLMIIHLLSKMNEDEKKRFLEIMNKKREQKTQDEVNEILSLMEKYKSIDYARQKARALANKALEKFDKNFADIPDSESKHAIRALITFVIERDM